MQLSRIIYTPAILAFAALVALAPQAAAQEPSCCNAALPTCPTPPLRFGIGPACCPGGAERCDNDDAQK